MGLTGQLGSDERLTDCARVAMAKMGAVMKMEARIVYVCG